MPRIKIDNKIVISYDHTARDKYWTALSTFLVEKHGILNYKEHRKVEEILLDAFSYLVERFKQLIHSEKIFTFYLYVFWLHEQSIEIHHKTLDGLKLEEISEQEFAMYRRILKLILEQGCDIDLRWGEFPINSEIELMDNKIQELIYLGSWMYEVADKIALHKVLKLILTKKGC